MYFWIHLVLAIALTAYFLFRFLKDRLTYQLLFLIWVPTTLLTYIPFLGQNQIWRIILGAYQFIMFLLVIFFMFRKDPKKKSENTQEDTPETEDISPSMVQKDAPEDSDSPNK